MRRNLGSCDLRRTRVIGFVLFRIPREEASMKPRLLLTQNRTSVNTCRDSIWTGRRMAFYLVRSLLSIVGIDTERFAIDTFHLRTLKLSSMTSVAQYEDKWIPMIVRPALPERRVVLPGTQHPSSISLLSPARV